MKKIQRLMAAAALAVLCADLAGAADRDPQAMLKEAERFFRASDTPAAIARLRECVTDPAAREWMVEEAVKLFVTVAKSSSDSPSAYALFSAALRSPRAGSAVPAILNTVMNYPWLSSEEKLSLLSGMRTDGKIGEGILDVQVQLLRRLGRLDPALELAAQLAQKTGQLDHRIQVVDLLLDLSRTKDAASLSNSILLDASADPSAYSLLAERFHRHGEYQQALDIQRRARSVFSNPMLFFDQSLSICQGLQLGREGIELYLPVLRAGNSPAPEYFRDFLSMISDTDFLVRDYPDWIQQGQNPHLFLAAIFRFAEMAPDLACLNFVRLYRAKFENQAAHLSMAEHLLDRDRLGAFTAVLAEVSDTPVEVAETKKMLLYRHAVQTQGADKALAQFPPPTFSQPEIRASVYRIAAREFYAARRLDDAIATLQAARDAAADPRDNLRLAQMFFLAGKDSEALSSAHLAHRASATDETLYWLGWLSYLGQDTETAKKAFRDVALRTENFLADEALSWMIALSRGDKVPPKAVGHAMREAAWGKRGSIVPDDDFPTAVRIALWREWIRTGQDGKSFPAASPPFLQYLRWLALGRKERKESEYQKLLRDAPDSLRTLIRTEAP